MHLLKTDGSYELCRFDAPRLWHDRSKAYAILSHTWAKDNADEVSYADMADLESARKKPGWEKIEESCKKAARDSVPYMWIDTCCINKNQPHDQILGEINTMFQYYAQAEVCYVHLADVPGSCPQLTDRAKLKEVWPRSKWTWERHIMGSRWFTRGWTLQELIAPKKVEFYNRRWRWIGSLKGGLLEIVSKATLIPEAALNRKSGASLEDYTIAQRMAWAAYRRTTQEEDMAYCLVGIFNVALPYIPGERMRAFERLQLEIIKRSADHSIFAWNWQAGFERGEQSLLAPHPRCFRTHNPIVPLHATREETSRREHHFEMTNRGLQITLPLLTDQTKPADSRKRLALLNCCYEDNKGRKERIALLVKEIDDGKKRNKDPEYQVYFETYGKPSAKGEKEFTRLTRMSKDSANPSELKADTRVILLNGFI